MNLFSPKDIRRDLATWAHTADKMAETDKQNRQFCVVENIRGDYMIVTEKQCGDMCDGDYLYKTGGE